MSACSGCGQGADDRCTLCRKCFDASASAPGAEPIKRGDLVHRRDGLLIGLPARVMAVADNYAMCRYPGCVPFVEFTKDLIRVEKKP